MEQVTTAGIDLAKRVFSLHGVDGSGRVVVRSAGIPYQLMGTVSALPACLIGMEGLLGGAPMGTAFSGPGAHGALYGAEVCRGKNDGNDAEAICEAVARPNMRFVPVKSTEQKALLTMHRVKKLHYRENGDHQPAARAAFGVRRGAATTLGNGAPPGRAGR